MSKTPGPLMENSKCAARKNISLITIAYWQTRGTSLDYWDPPDNTR